MSLLEYGRFLGICERTLQVTTQIVCTELDGSHRKLLHGYRAGNGVKGGLVRVEGHKIRQTIHLHTNVFYAAEKVAVRTRLLGGIVNSETIVSKHVEQGGLAGVIQTEENNLCVLLVKSFSMPWPLLVFLFGITNLVDKLSFVAP